MNMSFYNPISAAAVCFALSASFTLPLYAVQTTDKQIEQHNPSNRSYLNGSFVGWSRNGELITSVGTYSVANIYVSDHIGTRAANYKAAAKPPQVTLEFSSGRLIKVTIY